MYDLAEYNTFGVRAFFSLRYRLEVHLLQNLTDMNKNKNKNN